MAFCMDATTGADRHDETRDADYSVYRTEAFAGSTWCVECLLKYIKHGMGSCLTYVERIRPVSGETEKIRHQEVLTALEPFKVECV